MIGVKKRNRGGKGTKMEPIFEKFENFHNMLLIIPWGKCNDLNQFTEFI